MKWTEEGVKWTILLAGGAVFIILKGVLDALDDPVEELGVIGSVVVGIFMCAWMLAVLIILLQGGPNEDWW